MINKAASLSHDEMEEEDTFDKMSPLKDLRKSKISSKHN